MIYHRFHQKLLSNIDQWIEKSDEEINDEEKHFFETTYPSTVAMIRPSFG